MKNNQINMAHRLFPALAMLFIMLMGCTPTLSGGIDATNLDPNVHPPRKRVLITDMAKDAETEDEAAEEGESLVEEDAPGPGDASGTEPDAEAGAPAPVEVAGSGGDGAEPDDAYEPEVFAADGAADERDHVYIDKDSGPVTLSRDRIYHWVSEGGELIVPAKAAPEKVASAAAAPEPQAPGPQGEERPEPVEVIEGQAPDVKALFRMDEVISLVQKYEKAMKARDPGALMALFTKDAEFRFSMKVPSRGATLTEKYNLGQFTDIHRNGWGGKMDYDFSVSGVTVSVSDDGTTAVADSQAAETMAVRGTRVSAGYVLTFFVEKMGQRLILTGLRADGEISTMPDEGSR